jgi:cell wall-associated NlpC family hydrolase
VRKSVAAAVVAVVTGTTLIAGTPEANAATVESKALSIAASKKGAPYQWGAEGPKRFDCSGLTWYAFKHAGKTIPRVAQSQYNSVHHVATSNRHKGDLVFIGTSSRSIYHVGIYAGYWSGKGWMWNANTGSYRGRKVVLAPIKEYTAGSPRAYYGRV